jgi:hypothetical protein
MIETTPQIFAMKTRAVVVAPAGCGKTHLIAEAVRAQEAGRQLILTHTHAGVRSLRDKLRLLGVPSRCYNVETIAGFALKYAVSFPHTSGLTNFMPVAKEWKEVYEPARKIFSSSVGNHILRSSYSGLYVDEYQDCTLIQHELIKKLAEVLPCRIVGDPLQGIFDFEDSPLVDWSKDVFSNFEILPELNKPWRWMRGDKKLGEWLLTVRTRLVNGETIDMQTAPAAVRHSFLTVKNQTDACYRCPKDGTVVAIHRMPQQAHYVAQKLGGKFDSMEEIEGKDLLSWSEQFEKSTGSARAIAVIDFASKCMTQVSIELSRIKTKLSLNETNITAGLRKNIPIAQALTDVVNSRELEMTLKAMLLIEQIPGRVLYRRELWNDMKRAIKELETGTYASLREAAWKVRDRGRVLGRKPAHRTVSRTLLIKGLEFDHAIVLDADALGTKELYVAMTRGCKSLIVLSSSRNLQKQPLNADLRTLLSGGRVS